MNSSPDIVGSHLAIAHSVVVNMRNLSPTAHTTITAFLALAAVVAQVSLLCNGTGTTTVAAAAAAAACSPRSLERALATVERKIPTRELTGGFRFLPADELEPRSILPLPAQSAARNAMTVWFVNVQQSHPAYAVQLGSKASPANLVSPTSLGATQYIFFTPAFMSSLCPNTRLEPEAVACAALSDRPPP